MLKHKYQDGYHEMQKILLDGLAQPQKIVGKYHNDGSLASFHVGNQEDIHNSLAEQNHHVLLANIAGSRSSSSAVSPPGIGTSVTDMQVQVQMQMEMQVQGDDSFSAQDSMNAASYSSNSTSWREDHNRKAALSRLSLANNSKKNIEIIIWESLHYMIDF